MAKPLGIPAIIWVLQLLYVAIALGLLAALSIKLQKQVHYLAFQIGYVLAMVIINIAWRITIKKLKPEWF